MTATTVRAVFFLWFLLALRDGAVPAAAGDGSVSDPISHYAEGYMESLDAMDDDYAGAILCRYRADFNNDGMDDLAVSGMFEGGWMAEGADWAVYLRTDQGGFVLAGHLAFHPSAMLLEPLSKGSACVVTRIPWSAPEGRLCTAVVSVDGISRSGCSSAGCSREEAAEREWRQRLSDAVERGHAAEFCRMTDYAPDRTCEWKTMTSGDR